VGEGEIVLAVNGEERRLEADVRATVSDLEPWLVGQPLSSHPVGQ